MPPTHPSHPSYPTGTVTFLFTDIEGSTQLWERYLGAMPHALARHDSIIRKAVEMHGGVVFRTLGDAFCAAFDSATRAVAAAVAAQRELLAEPWEAAGLPSEKSLRVRMALHAGVVELHNSDYLGQPLNRVARLLDAGHGGQILLSAAAWELVRDTVPPDVELHTLGEHRLKDLTRPEHIYQAVVSGLSADFPPLHTLDARRHNLPAQATTLIGRKQEVTALRELLRRADVRLVTLTGTGGTGKTRLGLQVAAEVLDEFTDGVFFVALAPIQDPALVTSAVAQALGVREAGGRPVLEQLHDMLRHRQILLVLDNFEQVVDAAPLVSSLLEVASQLKILVTSRMPLHLYGEHEYVVPPLTLPDLRNLPPLERLTQYAAVRLFIERAQAVKLDFAVTNATAPAVAEICHRLDGLPLAIELAAARSKLFSPPVLLAHLSSRLTLLTGGPRDLPMRHQTLRAAIDWSYNLLSPSEQTLFRRLAIFVGGCTLEATRAVCNAAGDLEIDVLDGLIALTDQSLLRQDEVADGEPRFSLLETIREYALERLGESEKIDDLRRQHTTYYLALAEIAEAGLTSAERSVWMPRLEAEYDNIRGALNWIKVSGEGETALRLAGALGWFWYLGGHLREGRRWLESALEQVNTCPPTDPLVHLRAKALCALGKVAYVQGDYAQARAWLEEGSAIARTQANQHELADTLNYLGLTALSQGDYAAAQLYADESVALYRAIGNRWSIALGLIGHAYVALNQGDYPAARARTEESLKLRRDLRDTTGIAWALNLLGEVARHQGDYDQALKLSSESLEIYRRIGFTVGIALSLLNLGEVARAQGNYPRAAVLFYESLALWNEFGARREIARCLEGLAGLATARGQSARAACLYGAAEALRVAIGAPLPLGDRPTYKRDVITIRTQLDEATFEAAWATGYAMTLEQAIGYACNTEA